MLAIIKNIRIMLGIETNNANNRGNKMDKNRLGKGDITFLPLHDCFVRVIEETNLADNRIGYRVENLSEGIENLLASETEVYGIIKGM